MPEAKRSASEVVAQLDVLINSVRALVGANPGAFLTAYAAVTDLDRADVAAAILGLSARQWIAGRADREREVRQTSRTIRTFGKDPREDARDVALIQRVHPKATK
jgi:hypothetical protein